MLERIKSIKLNHINSKWFNKHPLTTTKIARFLNLLMLVSPFLPNAAPCLDVLEFGIVCKWSLLIKIQE